MEDPSELLKITGERDFYRRLLELGDAPDLPAFLKEALGLITGISGARQGYLAFQDGEGKPAWSASIQCSHDDVNEIEKALSHGIIAQALLTGKTLSTASAMEDPRFLARGSVQAHRIRAVLCAPVATGLASGVVYLQGRNAPGPFTEEDRGRAETFARHLAPLAERLLIRQKEEKEGDPTHPYRSRLPLQGVVGRSPALAEALGQVALVAPLEVTVLLTGESGTGKTELARVIHLASPRRKGPMVELNCAALPENLLESELFGAAPGAHSTAHKAVPGKVAAASGGTLFLDEIGEMPLGAQAKLLQLLQSRTYFRLGSSRAEVAEVRVVAATNADLASAIREKRFREDLFYRLSVLPIRVPSLRERASDIPLLARHFAEAACRRHRLTPVDLSPSALRAARTAEWPGNLRQLAHAIEAAVIRASGVGARTVEARHLFPGQGEAVEEGPPGMSFQEATRRFQARLVEETLEATQWNVSEASRRLDLARSHLHDLIRGFGIQRSRG